jgi:nicotinamide phosphoribosyltransferase
LTDIERKGTIEHLWDVFDGTVNEKGYKVLDSRIGMIYGDGITVQRSQEILSKLKAKGFASTNIVFGVGSYSLNMVSRDHLGMAIKATNAVVEIGGKDVDKPIYKDPKTDSTKKSARGLLSVHKDYETGEYRLLDVCSRKAETVGELNVVYMNGQFHKFTDVFKIRKHLWG